MYVEGGSKTVLRDLVKWLETQPAETTYDFYNVDGNCLMGRYGKATNQDWYAAHTTLWRDDKLDVVRVKPWTYGDALKRAKAYL